MTIEKAFQHLEMADRVSSPRALKRAYRKAVLKWHPDRFTDPTLKMDAEAATYGIMAAYEFLKSLPEDDERVYARPSSSWWRRTAGTAKPKTQGGAASPPVRQQWLTPQDPAASSWRHTDQDERCGPVRATLYSGLMAAVVMVAVVVISVQLSPKPGASQHLSASPAPASASKPSPSVAPAPQVLPPLRLAPSLLEDRRESTRRYQEARGKRRAFGEPAATQPRGNAAASGNREDQELERWSTEYRDQMQALRGR